MTEIAATSEETGLICQFGFYAMFRDMPSPHPENVLSTIGLHLLQDCVVYNSGHPSKFWVLRRAAVDVGPLTQAFEALKVPVFH